jgi:hypothetical protein
MNTRRTPVIAAVAAAALLAAAPATADFGPDYLPAHEPFWVAWDGDTGTCFALRADNRLGVNLGREHLIFTFADSSWQGLESRQIEVAVHFAAGEAFTGRADLDNGLVFFVPAPDRLADFIDRWASGSRVTLTTVRGHDFTFHLDGTAAALVALERCYTDHLDGPADDPFGEVAPSADSKF